MSQLTYSYNANRATAYSLLLILLFLWAGGAVSHYCFDGKEPPVTVHFDSLSGHDDHDGESGHVDLEKPALADNLITKLFKFDTAVVGLALILFCQLSLRGILIVSVVSNTKPRKSRSFLPPLRAPPAYSC